MTRALIVVATVCVVVAALFVAHYQLLVMGGCEQPPHLRIARLHGQVVGRSLSVLQYRWLRRLFTAGGTPLTVMKEGPDTSYQGDVFKNIVVVAEKAAEAGGEFDFGELPPGDYSLLVGMPAGDSVSFGFSIDPAASDNGVLIDASPGYYCWCCGWNFELRGPSSKR